MSKNENNIVLITYKDTNYEKLCIMLPEPHADRCVYKMFELKVESGAQKLCFLNTTVLMIKEKFMIVLALNKIKLKTTENNPEII